MKQPTDYWLAEDPASGCRVLINEHWNPVDCKLLFSIRIDDKDPIVRGRDELELELGLEIMTPPMQIAFEILRRHVISDAHADMSFVELAAR